MIGEAGLAGESACSTLYQNGDWRVRSMERRRAGWEVPDSRGRPMTGSAGPVERLACLELRGGNHLATYALASQTEQQSMKALARRVCRLERIVCPTENEFTRRLRERIEAARRRIEDAGLGSDSKPAASDGRRSAMTISQILETGWMRVAAMKRGGE